MTDPIRLTDERPPMSDAEGDAWDALHDDNDCLCTCDGCNYYSPTYNDALPCKQTTYINAIADARVEAAERALVERLTRAARHPHKGPDDTDVSMLLAAAKRLDGGFEPGGSNTKQTVARVCRAVADLLATDDRTDER